MIVSFDPGSKNAGCAFFDEESRQLISAFLARGDEWHATALDALQKTPIEKAVTQVVIEVMQVYQGPKQKGNPNDLTTLCVQAGYLSALLSVRKPVEYLPAEWKGQTPKDAMLTRIKKRLSKTERDCIELPAPSLAHNVWDAIGIGLKFLKRM